MKFRKDKTRYETLGEFRTKNSRANHRLLNFIQDRGNRKKLVLMSVIIGLLIGGLCFYLLNFRKVDYESLISEVGIYELFPTTTYSTQPTLNLEWIPKITKEKDSRYNKDLPFEVRLDEEVVKLTYDNYKWSTPLTFEEKTMTLSLETGKQLTLYDPEEIESLQTLSLIAQPDGTWKLINKMNLTEGMHVDKASITYDILNYKGETLVSVEPLDVSERNQIVEVSAVINPSFQNELLTFVRVNVKINEVVYHLFLNPLITDDLGSTNIKTVSQNDKYGLLNQMTDHLTFNNHYFFSESLHFTLEESQLATYQLVSPYETKEPMNYYAEANEGVDLTRLPSGDFFLFANDLPIFVNQEFTSTWYTVQRQGRAKQVTLSSSFGLLMISVKEITELPEDVYDLIIDPGHGGIDQGTVGNGLFEANEALVISNYLKQRFEEHGLKVKLTREGDYDPAQQETFIYDEAPYAENGRVDQVYRYQAKYVIANHLNAVDSQKEGTEVYSSIVTNDRWSRLILDQLTLRGRVLSDSLENHFRVSEGSYKRYYACPMENACRNPYVDYLYMIRETGGFATDPITVSAYSSTYPTVPHYGAETILVEYAYLDNYQDAMEWYYNWQSWAEAVLEGTLNYLNIPYQPVIG